MTQKIQFYVDGWHGGYLSEVSMIYFLKFIFSEKATKFCEITNVDMTVTTQDRTGDFAKICGLLRIGTYMNFNNHV